MTPQDIENLYNQIGAAVTTATDVRANNIDVAARAKGPSLGGRNVPGSYNYNRYVAPTTTSLVSQLVTKGKQMAFKQTLNDALQSASSNYDNARRAYAGRQAARAAAAASASSGSSIAGNVGGNTVTGVKRKKVQSGTAISPEDLQAVRDGRLIIEYWKDGKIIGEDNGLVSVDYNKVQQNKADKINTGQTSGGLINFYSPFKPIKPWGQ